MILATWTQTPKLSEVFWARQHGGCIEMCSSWWLFEWATGLQRLDDGTYQLRAESNPRIPNFMKSISPVNLEPISAGCSHFPGCCHKTWCQERCLIQSGVVHRLSSLQGSPGYGCETGCVLYSGPSGTSSSRHSVYSGIRVRLNLLFFRSIPIFLATLPRAPSGKVPIIPQHMDPCLLTLLRHSASFLLFSPGLRKPMAAHGVCLSPGEMWLSSMPLDPSIYHFLSSPSPLTILSLLLTFRRVPLPQPTLDTYYQLQTELFWFLSSLTLEF